MPSSWARPVTLENDHVTLAPLELRHAAALAKAAQTLATFRYFSRIPLAPSLGAITPPAPGTPGEMGKWALPPAIDWDRPVTTGDMEAFINFLLGPADTVAFSVIPKKNGAPSGITTYLDIKDAHRGLEIGWTWYAPAARGGASTLGPVNPSCKLLLMRHAFEDLGAIRVCLKTDERNARSRAAIEKLGGRLEGLLRSTMVMPEGHRRTTAMYSILDHEWPAARAKLEERLRTA